MPDFETIFYQQHDAILAILFNRPEVMNAMSPQLLLELKEAMQFAAEEETIKVVLVTGAGKAWSAGVDLKAVEHGMADGTFDAEQFHQDANDIIHLIQTMPKPVIAVVNGPCYTGALEMMMAFDLVIAAEEATFADTHAKWGLLPKWGMSQRLSQLVGPMKARELSFTCDLITGKEAASIGLVNKAVPLDILDETVSSMVKKILDNKAKTIAAFKHLFYTGEQGVLKDGLQLEKDYESTINVLNKKKIINE